MQAEIADYAERILEAHTEIADGGSAAGSTK